MIDFTDISDAMRFRMMWSDGAGSGSVHDSSFTGSILLVSLFMVCSSPSSVSSVVGVFSCVSDGSCDVSVLISATADGTARVVYLLYSKIPSFTLPICAESPPSRKAMLSILYCLKSDAICLGDASWLQMPKQYVPSVNRMQNEYRLMMFTQSIPMKVPY